MMLYFLQGLGLGLDKTHWTFFRLGKPNPFKKPGQRCGRTKRRATAASGPDAHARPVKTSHLSEQNSDRPDGQLKSSNEGSSSWQRSFARTGKSSRRKTARVCFCRRGTTRERKERVATEIKKALRTAKRKAKPTNI